MTLPARVPRTSVSVLLPFLLVLAVTFVADPWLRGHGVGAPSRASASPQDPEQDIEYDGAVGQDAAVLLLQRARERLNQGPISYREVRVFFRSKGPETVTGQIWRASPDRFRYEHESSEGRRHVVIRGDGEQWLFDSELHAVLHTQGVKASERHATSFPGTGVVPGIPSRSSAKMELSITKQDGRPAVYVVEAVRDQGRSLHWIDEASTFPRKEEYYAPSDQLTAIVLRTDWDLSPDLPESLFRFDAPPGVQVVTDTRSWLRLRKEYAIGRRLPFPVALPAYLPDDYVLVGGNLTSTADQPVVHLRFYNGRHLMSLFQMKGSPFQAALPDDEASGLLALSTERAGYYFLIVGHVSKPEAEQILDSLEWNDQSPPNSE